MKEKGLVYLPGGISPYRDYGDLFEHCRPVSEGEMFAVVPPSVKLRYMGHREHLFNDLWYASGNTPNTCVCCAFTAAKFFDSDCDLSYGFVRTGEMEDHSSRFEFRVLLLEEHVEGSGDGYRYFFRDDFTDGDFERIIEYVESDELWDYMYKPPSSRELMLPYTGNLIETQEVNILDLCKSAYARERERGVGCKSA